MDKVFDSQDYMDYVDYAVRNGITETTAHNILAEKANRLLEEKIDELDSKQSRAISNSFIIVKKLSGTNNYGEFFVSSDGFLAPIKSVSSFYRKLSALNTEFAIYQDNRDLVIIVSSRYNNDSTTYAVRVISIAEADKLENFFENKANRAFETPQQIWDSASKFF